MHVYSCTDIMFYVVVREGDEICHIERNESSEFITLWQWLHVLEEKSGRGENLSRELNLLLKSKNPDMKIFKMLSVLEVQGG